MQQVQIAQLAKRIQEHRAGRGIRDAAKDVGVSPATLSRIENGKIPDLETFGKVCRWLGVDPAIYLGLPATRPTTPTVKVHFKKGTAIEADSARALGEMILAAHQALMEEDPD